MGVIVDTFAWLVAIELIGLAALPLSLRVLYGLPDRGYAVARILGLLLVAYAAWATAILGLTAFTGPTIVVLTLALGAVGWTLWGSHVLRGWRQARSWAIGAEITFLLVFLGGVWVRAHNAAIAGQEKQMDFTFLHSLIRTASLPAEDLWMAGHGMPYYYFGYLVQSLIPKVVPVDPAVAYNLAVATVLAASAMGAFGLGAALTQFAGAGRRMALGGGAVGALGLTVMGNLQAFFELIAAQGVGDSSFWSVVGIKNLQANSQGFPPPDGGWWFKSARVIPNIQPDGITEFPYFSFLLGDLHPHYMAIPLAVLIVTLAFHELIVAAPLRTEAIRLGVAAIALGAVIPSNTWDLPVFWGTFALALVAGSLRAEGVRRALLGRAWDLGALALLAVLCYAPYFVGYTSQPLGIGLVQERTLFGSLVVLFGPLLVLAFTAGAVAAFGPSPSRWGEDAEPASAESPSGAGPSRPLLPKSDRSQHPAVPLWPFVPICAGAGLAAFREPTLGFLVAGLGLWIPLTWMRVRSGASPSAVAAGIMTTVGLGSILVAEVVFLRDVFDSRMNTVFKFYYDAWILLALAAPLLAWELLAAAQALRARWWQPVEESSEADPEPPGWLRAFAAASLAAAGSLALACLIYPVAATTTKSGGFSAPPTLDGMTFLRQFRADDAAAIEAIKRSRPRGGVVEAVGHDYTEAGRVSTFAGIPTLIGWVGHELQWRGPIPEIERRQQLARRVYTDPDAAGWRAAVAQLGMELVVVGNLEREMYGQAAGAELERQLTVVHRGGSTTVYALRAPAVARADR